MVYIDFITEHLNPHCHGEHPNVIERGMRTRAITFIEFGLQAKPSILYVRFVALAARRDHYHDLYRWIYNYNSIIGGLIIINF